MKVTQNKGMDLRLCGLLGMLLLFGWAAASYGQNNGQALITASKNGNIVEVNALLANGADVNAKDKNDITALMLASEDGHSEVVNALLANGADVNAKGKNAGGKYAKGKDDITALMRASLYGHSDIVKLLKAAGAKE